MAFMKLDLNLDPAIFAEHGVDIHGSTAQKRFEERNKRMERKYNQQAIRNRQKLVWDKSLWGSGEIEFTFKDWKPDERQNQAKARNLGNKAFKLAKEMVNGHLNVAMSGLAGVGKTSLALAMANALKDSGKTVLFVSVIALSELLSEQYDYQDRKERLQSLRKTMCSCDVLILDDLGADGGSVDKVMTNGYTGARKDMQTLMFEVANCRYEGTKDERKKASENHKKLAKPVHQTIITTNNLTKELKKIYGERTISRLVTQDPNHRLAFNDMEDMRVKEGI